MECGGKPFLLFVVPGRSVFSRAGCRIFQKQLCASGADSAPAQKGFCLSSSLPPFLPPTSLSLALRRHAWLRARTYSNSHSTRNIRSLQPRPPPSTFSTSSTPRQLPSLQMTLDHFSPPAHSRRRAAGLGRGVEEGGGGGVEEVGGGCPLLLCDYIITERRTCVQYLQAGNLSLRQFFNWMTAKKNSQSAFAAGRNEQDAPPPSTTTTTTTTSTDAGQVQECCFFVLGFFVLFCFSFQELRIWKRP